MHVQVHLIAANNTIQKLTIKSFLCLCYTPRSSSDDRHSFHSNSVFSTNIQSSQVSTGRRGWDREERCTTPRSCPPFSVLHPVQRDGLITLGSVPGHPQRWYPRCHCLGQRNTTNSWGNCQRDFRMKLLYRYAVSAMQRTEMQLWQRGWHTK